MHYHIIFILFLTAFILFLRWDEKETEKYIKQLTEAENDEETT